MLDSLFSSSVLYAMFFGGLILYFLPTLIAVLRGHPQKVPIFILDLLACWTMVGWVVAIVWSCTKFEGNARASVPPVSKS